jgi:ABC-type branched-subunit amino acid transport system substrate-binding protein
MSSAAKTPAAKKSTAKKAVKSQQKKTLIGSTKTKEEVKMSSFIYQKTALVAVFLISMSHALVSHHIIYLYKVVPIKFVSLEVSCSY